VWGLRIGSDCGHAIPATIGIKLRSISISEITLTPRQTT